MKTIDLIRLIIICCLTLSCTPKTEQKQPIIINDITQNYKFDDDDLILKKNAKEAQKKKQIHQDKRKKANLKK